MVGLGSLGSLLLTWAVCREALQRPAPILPSACGDEVGLEPGVSARLAGARLEAGRAGSEHRSEQGCALTGCQDLDQLTQILKVTGVPGAEFVQKLKDKAAKSYIQSLPQTPKKDFTQLFPRASPQAADLLDKMLELDVDKRLTAAQALAHPFFEPFRDPEEETEAQQPFDDALEHEKLSVDEWKQLIYKEISNFSPIARKDSRRRSGMKLQ